MMMMMMMKKKQQQLYREVGGYFDESLLGDKGVEFGFRMI